MINKNVDNVNYILDDGQTVFEVIHHLMHSFRAKQYKLIQETGLDLTHMEHKVMAFFARHPESKLSDLVKHSGRDKSQIARLINELKAKELLDSFPDEHDKRAARLSLSSKGVKVFDSLVSSEKRISSQSVRGLSKDECALLIKLLKQVSTNLSDGNE
jgi:DNA-binding MarR family transcriptional regulator